MPSATIVMPSEWPIASIALGAIEKSEQQTRRRNRRLESAAEIGVAVGAVIDIG